ncbi:arylamine N-acetyltransferase, pineal gland isozyme NAT-3-like [Mustelus asterias]
MDADRYLARIGFQGSRRPSLVNMMQIHRCHVLSVPFGSLANHCGEDIFLELPFLYRKVVDQRHAGFCYKLNGLFSWRLGELGCTGVSLPAAQVHSLETQRYGPPREHLALLVELEGRRWLCDVAFGKCFRSPLILEAEREQRQETGTYTLRLTTTQFTLSGDRENSVTIEIEEERIPEVLKEQFRITLRKELVPKEQDIIPPSTPTEQNQNLGFTAINPAPKFQHFLICSSEDVRTFGMIDPLTV